MRWMTLATTLRFSLNRLLHGSAISARRPSPRSPTLPPAKPRMNDGAAAASRSPATKPAVSKVQSILGQGSEDGWEKCWEEGVTPWDLGNPTPLILHLVEAGDLPSGKALVPGCGSGYDVVALASPERHVLGVDLSQTAINEALERTSELPNKEQFRFLAADFFKWQTAEQFDLIYDYTFFCAIDPSMRPAWAEQIGNLLKPDGELITLMFPIDQFDGGPPFAVSVRDYEEVLGPLGFKAVTVVDNEFAIGPRKGREMLGRWKRTLQQSYM